MECKFCGREFEPDAKHPHQKYCSIKCGRAHRDGLIAREAYRKEVEAKTLSDWVREARECNLDYGTYRGLRNLGKSFEELKATADTNRVPTHAHNYGNRPVAKRF